MTRRVLLACTRKHYAARSGGGCQAPSGIGRPQSTIPPHQACGDAPPCQCTDGSTPSNLHAQTWRPCAASFSPRVSSCCPACLLAAAPPRRRLDFCETLLQAATAYGISGCWQWKPLLDGKQVGLVPV